MALQEFYDALNRADWYYAYSDDGRVARRGSERMAELKNVAVTSVEHRAMFEAFRSHMFDTGNERAPKPTRPD
jgi:hypothetical protein